MGRELKRVPLDFDWPLNKRWEGFINPYWQHKCPEEGVNCFAGYSAAYKWLRACAEVLTQVAESAKRGPSYLPRELAQSAYRPCTRDGEHTAPVPEAFASFVRALAKDDRPSMLGVDAHLVCARLMEVVGVSDDWMECPVCKGSSIHPDYREQHAAWERTEPPTSPGFQLWETTSEGSPVSPVFETLDALCEWAADHATTFGRARASAEQWKKMLDDGLVCHREGNILFL